MPLVDSLLTAIVRSDGDALVLHVGEKPYVVAATGAVELSRQGLGLGAMEGLLAQLLSAEALRDLREIGAVEHELPSSQAAAGDRFTVVAARGGDDIWIEIRRHRRVQERPVEQPVEISVDASVGTPPAVAHDVVEAAPLPPEVPAPHHLPAVQEAPAEVEISMDLEPAMEPVPHVEAEVAPVSAVDQDVAVDAPPAPAVPEPVAPVEVGEPIPLPTFAPFTNGSVEPRSELAELPSIDSLMVEGMVPQIDEPEAEPEVTLAAPEAPAAPPAAEAEAPVPPPVAPPAPVPVAVAEASPPPPAIVFEPFVPIIEWPSAPPPAVVVPMPPPAAAAAPAAAVTPARAPLAPAPAAAAPATAAPAAPAPSAPVPVVSAPIATAPPPQVAVAAEIPPARRVEPPAPRPLPRVEVPTPAAEPAPAPLVAPEPAYAPLESPSAFATEPQPTLPGLSTGPFEAPLEAGRGEAAADTLPAVVLSLTRDSARGTGAGGRGGVRPGGIERLLRLASARGASALYLTTQARPAVRVDGDIRLLESETALSSGDVEAAVLELAPEGARDKENAEWIRDLQDIGRVRITTFRDYRGPGALLRMISARPTSAEQLGLVREIQALATEPEGLVIVTGPRASGKSTLVSAFVDLINRQRNDYVVTLEGQIRLVHESRGSLISQREVRGSAADVVSAARAALRENPDVMVIEDLRSPDVLQVALDAAGSGLLVFASVTAASATAALERLVDLCPSEQRRTVRAALAEHLRGVVAQVLLRKAGGGRLAARELVLNTNAVAALVSDGQIAQLPRAIDSGRKLGMAPLNDALVAFVQSGAVDVREAYRKADDKSGLLALLRREGIDTSFVERLA